MKDGPPAWAEGPLRARARAEKSGPAISSPALSGLGLWGGEYSDPVSVSDASESDGRYGL